MRAAHLLAGAALVLTSALALAQDGPESLLPPGFDQPAPARTQAPASRPAGAPTAAPAGTAPAPAAPRGDATPVVQSLSPPGAGAGGPAASPASTGGLTRIPTIDELARMTPEDFQSLLGVRADFDMPPGARRSLERAGIIDADEGGLPEASMAGQNDRLVRLALAANRGTLVSRWGHIVLRRALASRLQAPAGMDPAEFLALRTALLLRMGEADAARALIQDADIADYTPQLTSSALEVYTDTADFTGVCPVLAVQGAQAQGPRWDAARAICLSFRGNGAAAMSQLDRAVYRGTLPKIDLLLAQRYAGAAGRSRRAVTIEWDGIEALTPWTLGLANAVGLNPPDKLVDASPPSLAALTAQAPAVGLARRAQAADRAGAAGILSSAAMVDLYSQLYVDPDVKGDWSQRSEKLRDAYGLDAPSARLAAMQSLWDGGKDETARYSRLVLTAYAAARLPATADMAGQSGDLIAAMLAAGLDANAARWAGVVEAGSLGWALLAVGTPSNEGVDGGALSTFLDDDGSEGRRKAAFLLAGLAGLGRIEIGDAVSRGEDLGVDLAGATRYTRTIDAAASHRDVASVALLAGLGMQGSSWARMTPRYLYHIVAALRRAGLDAEARMIAAEAVARG